jgi:glycosyltransferase involved in cell wall biosynthesis
VLVNSKYNAHGKRWSDLEWLKALQKPTLLFCGNAEAHVLPPDEFLDLFDLVYKRELLRDTARYLISEANRGKLRTTMLSCQIVKLDPRSPGQWQKDNFRRRGEPYDYDVFFSGKLKTNPIRQNIVQRLTREGIRFYGGLQYPTPGAQSYEQRRLPFEEYENAINRSKINIAPEGYGQFTHRHLEIWCMGGFCLSTPSIREVTLPLGNPQEGVHYVAFDDLDDMVEKIRYYLTHDDERETIAAAGRSLFETIYDPARHGEAIRQEVQAIVPQDGSF